MAVMRFAIGRGHEQTDVLADHLIGGIAENRFRRVIEGLNDAIGSDGDDGIRRDIQNNTQLLIQLPQLLRGPLAGSNLAVIWQ